MKMLTRTILILLIAVTCNLVYSQGVMLADKSATSETRKIFEKIQKLSSSGIMIGHQDDMAYGIGWKAPEKKSDIYSILGDYPAVFGWDLGQIETGSAWNLDSVPFASMKKFAREVHMLGGINSFSWHLRNPLTSGNSWDVSNDGVVASILPGGEKHQLYCFWLNQVASFFKSLKDENELLIPVLFRPFHEHTGDWFWWGKTYCTPDEFHMLWQFTFNYLTDSCQTHNLIFVFSSGDNFSSVDDFLDRYPGDQYTDMLGFDFYQGNRTSNHAFSSTLQEKLDILTAAGIRRNKPVALTETGYETIPYNTWWTEVLWPTIEKYPLSYVLLWRNAANRPNHYYAPFPGQQSEQDFKNFYHLKGTLFLNDIHGKNY